MMIMRNRCSAERTVHDDIREHLTCLLNSRHGTVPHLPDYGLPDVAHIYQKLPYSIADLVFAITKTVEKYEPRLSNICVKYKPSINKEHVLFLEIEAELLLPRGEEVKFASYFMPNGDAYIG